MYETRNNDIGIFFRNPFWAIVRLFRVVELRNSTTRSARLSGNIGCRWYILYVLTAVLETVDIISYNRWKWPIDSSRDEIGLEKLEED